MSSIQNMLKKVGVVAHIVSGKTELEAADKIILAGVGAFDNCMEKLGSSGLVDTLNTKVLNEGTPVLGICAGMQMLTMESEEGVLPGLGWIKAKTVRFREQALDALYKVPHMGWSELILRKHSPLFEGMDEEARFYFAHSYHLDFLSKDDVLMDAYHGYNFPAVVEHRNILGVQFHPEKSHRYGMRLLLNFVNHYWR